MQINSGDGFDSRVLIFGRNLGDIIVVAVTRENVVEKLGDDGTVVTLKMIVGQERVEPQKLLDHARRDLEIWINIRDTERCQARE